MNQKTVKKYSSLALDKYRKKYGLFLAEGHHIIHELLRSDWGIESIITSNVDIFEKLKRDRSISNVELVKSPTINRISTTKTPQEILAVVKIPDMLETDLSILRKIVIADGIKDPGNMGTIIRTARAFGFDALMTTSNSVDIFNPKVVRSTQGAMFGIKLFYDIAIESVGHRLKPAHTLYALDPNGDIDIKDVVPADKSALLIGSEIEGLSETLLNLADYRIRISHSGSVDSLNAAVAGGIAMHLFGAKS